MKQSLDNQINASFIDISRIKWLVFFYCGRLSSAQLVPLASSEATAYYRPAYRRDIKDNGYKSVFTNSWLVRQRNRSWIKGLGKNPQKSELIHWRQCLLSGATEPCPSDSEKHLRVYTSWPHVACWHGPRQNSQKTECVLRRPPIGSWKRNCGFKRHPMRTG